MASEHPKQQHDWRHARWFTPTEFDREWERTWPERWVKHGEFYYPKGTVLPEVEAQ